MENRLFFTVLFVLILSATLPAQRRSNQAERSSAFPPAPDSVRIVGLVAGLDTLLNLTPEQKGHITRHYFDHFRQVDQAHKENQGDPRATRVAMDDLREQLVSRVNEQLTDTQAETYQKFMEKEKQDQVRDRMQRRDRFRPPRQD